MSDNQLSARINILPGDDSGAQLLDDVNQRIAGMRQRVEAVDKSFENLEQLKLDTVGKDLKSVESGLTGIVKQQKALADVNKRIEELKNEFRSGAKDVDRFTKELSELEGQARKLDSALDAVGEKRRFDSASGDLVDPEQRGAGSGLRAFGRELRNLPSTQIPGLGIGTDAVGNITRVSGALVDASEKSKVATTAINLLTPALGAQAAATAGAFAPIALLVGGFVAIGAGIKSLVDATSQNVDRINAFAENMRQLNDRIGSGLTTEEAEKNLDELSKSQERNKATLVELLDAYYSAEKQAGVLSGVVRVFSGDEEALSNQINETVKAIEAQDAELKVLNRALNDGSLAANDAAAQLEKLAEEEKKLTEQRQDSITKIQSLNDQEREANAQFQQQQLQSFQDRVRQNKRLDEDYKLRDLRAEEDHIRQLLKLNKSYHDQTTKIQADADKQATDVASNLAKQEEDLADKRTDVLEDFNEKIADAEAKFRKQAEKDAIEFGRRRREIENDFQRDSSEARLDFDVRAFKDAQDEQKRELADLRTDRKDAKNERLEELREEREAAAENHSERLQQIDEEVAKAREQAAERLEQIRLQTEEQLTSTQQVHEERLADDAETRAIMRQRELEDRERMATRQAEDTELQLARQQAVHDARIAQLNDLELKELAIYYERVNQLDTLLAKERELTTQLGGTPGINAPALQSNATALNNNVQSFLNGSTAPVAPSLSAQSLVGTQSANRRSPLANAGAFASRGAGSGGRNGNNINVTNQFSILAGDHLTKTDLANIKKQIREAQSETVAGIEMAFFEGQKVIR